MWFLFQMVISLLAFLFSGQLFLGQATSSTTSTQELLFPSRYFFRATPFYQEATSMLLPSSHFLRVGSLLGSYFSEQLLFWRRNCLEQRYLRKFSIFKADTSAQHQLFQRSYIFEKDHVSEKKYSALPTFPGELSF